MYILLIGYLYVIVMVAATSANPVKGLLWVLLLGVLPVWLIVGLKRRGQRRRAERRREQADAAASPPARSDSPSDP